MSDKSTSGNDASVAQRGDNIQELVVDVPTDVRRTRDVVGILWALLGSFDEPAKQARGVLHGFSKEDGIFEELTTTAPMHDTIMLELKGGRRFKIYVDSVGCERVRAVIYEKGEELAKINVARKAVEARVAAEIDYAMKKWGKGYASAHEAFAVLLEEVEEFKAEVWKRRSERDRRLMIEELIQVAAVAQKFASQLVEETGGMLCPCGAKLDAADAVVGHAFCADCREGIDAGDEDDGDVRP